MAHAETRDDELRLAETLRQMADRVRTEVKYNPQRFRQMLAEYGGFGTARRLLDKREISDGFSEIMAHGKVEITMEHIVQLPEWRDFFSPEQLAWAAKLTKGR